MRRTVSHGRLKKITDNTLPTESSTDQEKHRDWKIRIFKLFLEGQAETFFPPAAVDTDNESGGITTMSQAQTRHDSKAVEENPLPFVAPCTQLQPLAAVRWLRNGWHDFRQAPGPSLCYGGFLVLISYLMAAITWTIGGYWLIFGVMSGFVFIAPVLAIGLYSISCQRQRGLKPKIGYCLTEGKRHLGDEMVFAVILLVVFLLWARAASMVHVFFPMETGAGFQDMLVFLGIGSLVGALFTAIVFSASAFSLPMMLDRKVDTVTAVVSSVNAVLRNKLAMLVWAGIIGVCLLVGFATAFLGLGILLPVIGYATWHGYQETIQAQDWPENVKLPEKTA